MKKRGRKLSSYHRKNKAAAADRYGEFANGRRLTADVIAGRRIGGTGNE